MVNALAAGDGEEPGREFPPAVEPAHRLKCPHEGVLCQLPGVGAVAAKVGYESIHAGLIAIDQLFKRRQGASLALPRQLLVGACLEFRGHS